MKKLSKRKENYKTIKMLIIITILFTCISVGYSYLTQDVTMDATINMLPTLNYGQNEWNSGERTVYQVNDFVITNSQEVDSYGWELIFTVPSDAEIVGCWNIVCEVEDSKLIITNGTGNAVITSGDSITVSFQFSTVEADYILNLFSLTIFSAEKPNPSEIIVTEGIDVTMGKAGPWGGGSNYTTQYSVTIANNTETDFMYWEIHFDISTSNITISNYWNCEYVIRDNELVVTGVSYNIALNVGASASFGIAIVSSNNTFNMTLDHALGKGISG